MLYGTIIPKTPPGLKKSRLYAKKTKSVVVFFSLLLIYKFALFSKDSINAVCSIDSYGGLQTHTSTVSKPVFKNSFNLGSKQSTCFALNPLFNNAVQLLASMSAVIIFAVVQVLYAAQVREPFPAPKSRITFTFSNSIQLISNEAICSDV